MSTVPTPSPRPVPRPPGAPQGETAGTSPAPEGRFWLLRITKGFVVFVYAVVLIDLVMLLLGFFLRLFGASTDAEFTRWVYRSVDRIMEPFRGMFPTVQSGKSVLDVSLLFAMIVYTIAAIALHCLVVWLTDRILAIRRRQQAEARQIAGYGPTPPY